MLTYKEREVAKVGKVIDVYLGKKKTGTIYRVRDGWQYQVNKKHVGEVFPTIAEVKRSLESE